MAEQPGRGNTGYKKTLTFSTSLFPKSLAALKLYLFECICALLLSSVEWGEEINFSVSINLSVILRENAIIHEKMQLCVKKCFELNLTNNAFLGLSLFPAC